MTAQPIYVTEPFLPPLDEFTVYLREIWDSKILTNGGKYHSLLEEALCSYLGVNYISLFSNGTLALITALQSLRITGEVITTPYSFVATAHSLLWNGNKPVFVDIDKNTLNIDPAKIERAITPQTTAIMPVHCYGKPCEIEAIQNIADVYNLKIIYDAAHAFGVKRTDSSLLLHGDMSVLSFHATKVFNTFEGGAIVSHSKKDKQRIDRLKNFGFVDETTISAPGINGKMSEFNAALGLLQLNYMPDVIQARKKVDTLYRQGLEATKGIDCLQHCNSVEQNYSYFPVLVKPEYGMSRDELYGELKSNGINTRRYFYPLISNFSMYRGLDSAAPANLPVATQVANEVLCLPIYPSLDEVQQQRIIAIISRV